MLRAANSIADSKHADQPAAKSCSGLVPVPGLPGRDSLPSRRPSELRDMPPRPPVVWAFAVYSTFSSRFMTSSFTWVMVLVVWRPRQTDSAIVRRSQIREVGKQIDVGPDLVPGHLPIRQDCQEG